MKEPAPQPTPLREGPRGRAPVDQAMTGLVLAVNTVVSADDRAVSADWEARQHAVAAWIVRVRRGEGGPGLAHLVADAIVGREIGSAAVAVGVGTSDWDEILGELSELLAWAEVRTRASEEKCSIIDRSWSRADHIRAQLIAELGQICSDLDSETNQIPETDDAAIQAAVAAARARSLAASVDACAQLGAETRTILDLDEDTVAISVADFLASHDLSVEHML